MRCLSFAKINLSLEVLGRRGDGFHELRTIFQTIDLADEIELDRLPGAIEIEVLDAPDVPADERNLAWRAAESWLTRWGRPRDGVRIRLRKRIPAGGGLGGGSSNAATVLLGLGALLEREVPRQDLQEAAAELGSDVPFFLVGGMALGTGRGEKIQPLPDPDATPLDVWLAVPPVAVSTQEIFTSWRPSVDLPGKAPAKAPGEWPGAEPPGAGDAPAGVNVGKSTDRPAVEGWRGIPQGWRTSLGRNDLESTCLALHPQVLAVYNRLSDSGALAVRLSGSGSTIFALYADRAAGKAAGSRLDVGTLWLRSSTLSRSEWRRRRS
ncbi:MAG: 4-(cytidine 5'-diphospho)-2-C-methyl-D-erythritol kinase [Thermoanaerobaculia bacterium]